MPQTLLFFRALDFQQEEEPAAMPMKTGKKERSAALKISPLMFVNAPLEWMEGEQQITTG